MDDYGIQRTSTKEAEVEEEEGRGCCEEQDREVEKTTDWWYISGAANTWRLNVDCEIIKSKDEVKNVAELRNDMSTAAISMSNSKLLGVFKNKLGVEITMQPRIQFDSDSLYTWFIFLSLCDYLLD